MKQKLLMLFATICLLLLTGCGSEDDKRESLPWNSKDLFGATYTMDDEGCYVLKDVVPPSQNELENKVLGKGWQPVAVYQILPNGKLSQDDYREKASNIDFACLYFDQENQLFAYYQDYALAGSPLCKKLWKEYTYEENTGILMRYDGFALKKDWSYLQILKIRESDSQTYLYTVQRLGNQPREDDGAEPVFGVVVYQCMSDTDLSDKIYEYTYDVDKGRLPDKVVVPENCKFHTRIQYAFPDEENDDAGIMFQTCRLLSFELTDKDGINQYPSAYYTYYDSIVWKCEDLPDTYVSVSKENHRMETLWSTYFFPKDKETIVTAMGYKNGYPVYEYSRRIYLYNDGFLGYNWSASQSMPDGFTLYCLFDKSREFVLRHGSLSQDLQRYEYAELYDTPKTRIDDENPESNMEKVLAEEKDNLVAVMDKLFRSHLLLSLDSMKAKCRARLKHLPDDVDVIMTWKDEPESSYGWDDYKGTYMVLVLKMDKERPQNSCYYIHAEPAE